ncbi:hypothetical protein HYV49_01010 [Candidatus Pacearchaeota archaeon]|nr:hypothetical protein [Candidatus Pacearchaeota archaeon]
MKSNFSNNCYNLATELSQKLKAVWIYDKMIKDARKGRDKETEEVLKKIRNDDIRHAEMLHNLIVKLAQAGKFK